MDCFEGGGGGMMRQEGSCLHEMRSLCVMHSALCPAAMLYGKSALLFSMLGVTPACGCQQCVWLQICV
jgi:hypothetical protein